MGNSISTFDNETQLVTHQGFDQSRIVGPENKEMGFGPIYRSTVAEELYTGYRPKDSPEENLQTVPQLLQLGQKRAGIDGNFLGQRVYRVAPADTPERSELELKALPKTYVKTGYVERPKDGTVDRFEYVYASHEECDAAINAFGRGLRVLGIDAGAHAGIFSVNRPEWIITQQAYYTQKMTVVPLYATLGPNAIEYIVNHSEIPVCVVSKENFPTLAKALPSILKTEDCKFKHIILIDCILDGKWGNTLDTVTDKERALIADTGIQLHGMSEIIAKGNTDEGKAIEKVLPTKDDIAFIMYTSGTTGVPKGVVLAHSNLTSAIGPIESILTMLRHKMTYFSYLPLAHIFEVVVNLLLTATGGQIAFSQGDVRQIVSDLQESKPHVIPGVPRIWTKFYQGAWSSINQMGFFKRWYIYRAYNYQLGQLRQNLPLDEGYDNKVFSVLRNKLGLDNATIMLTGAAPCPSYLVEFMRVLTNAFFSQGYGMTESTAATAISPPGDHLIGHCGACLPVVDFRLASVEDMGYTYNDDHPRGELLLSGEAVFKGYYKNEQATNETLVECDGRKWLRTGDIARINKNVGSISIIDRKKALLKLSQGEYVSLENCEGKYGQSPLVSQIWVYGNSYKSMLVAIIVPNVIPLYELALSNGWWHGEKPIAGALTDEVIQQCKTIMKNHREAVEAWMKATLLPCEQGLQGFEKIKAFQIDVDFDHLGLVWTDQNELLTPTMKLRRQNLAKHYIETLKHLYENIGEPHQEGEHWW